MFETFLILVVIVLGGYVIWSTQRSGPSGRNDEEEIHQHRDFGDSD